MAPTSPATANNGEFQETAAAETTAHGAQEYLCCAQCGMVADAHGAFTGGGLMQHMVQKHGGQCCLKTVWDNCSGSIARLVFAVTLSDRSLVASATPTGATLLSTNFPYRRQPGHQDAAASGLAAGKQLPQSSQPVPPGDPLDDSPLPNCSIRDVVLTDRDKQLLSELRLASAMALPRCAVSRYATAWAESLDGAMSSHQSWALLCRYHSRLLLAEIPKGVDRNSELKQRLHPC